MTIVESFRASSPQRQLTYVATGAALMCALLFGVYFLFLHKSYEVLFTDLRAMDAATIVAELDKKKVPYRLENGGSTILVPEDMVDTTRLNVMGEDLPLKGMVGFELFNKSDMGLTEFAQKINYQRALQGELARTIMTMEAVDTARVHLTLSTPTIFREDRIAPKASITVLTRPGKVLTPAAVGGIQRLVAAAVPELQLADVVVLDKRGEVLSRDFTPQVAASPVMQAKRAVEEYYAGRIRIALQRAYPASAADVSVSGPTLGLEQPVDGHSPSIENWSPGARDFPLNVTISTATPLSAESQDAFRYLAFEAIGTTATIGDAVTVAAAPVMAPPTAAPPSQTAAAPWMPTVKPKAGASRLSTFNLALVVALPILLLLFAAAFLLERRSTVRVLTVQQRGEYTQRLKTLLEREDADVGKAA